MKKKAFFIAAVLTAMFAQAKNHTIVVTRHHPTNKGNTEVKIDHGLNGDIITVMPGEKTSSFTIIVKDYMGEVITQGDITAATEGVYELTTPEMPEGNIVEVSDDKGVVYFDIE